VYFGQGKDFKLTTEMSKKVQYYGNQAIKNSLNEAILLMSIIKIKLYVSQVTETKFCMKIIQFFNANQ